MSHNVFGDRYVERESREGPAWHGIIKEVFGQDERVSCVDAVARAGGDFTVVKCPNGIILPTGESMQTGDYSLMREPVEGDMAWRSLGSCSEEYAPIQNMELAELIDKGGLTAEWPVETCGVLGKGERLFLVLRAGEMDVLGLPNQNVHWFYMATRGLKPGEGLNFTISTVKTVCQNTLEMALGSAAINLGLRQVGDVKGRIEVVNQLILKLQQAQEGARAQLTALAEAKVKPKQVKGIIDKAITNRTKPSAVKLWEAAGSPEDMLDERGGFIRRAKMMHEGDCETMELYRVGAVDTYDRICEMEPEIAGTAWAVVNAVTEVMDWADGKRKQNDREMVATFGWRNGAKVRALQEALAVAGYRD